MAFYPDMYMIEELLGVVASLLTSAVPSSLLGIASYVLSSMALYTLATRRGLSKAWLSWVPVLNVWIIGSLSDQYRYVVKGQYKSRRKWLLVLSLLNLVLGISLAVTAVITAVDLAGSAMYSVYGDQLLRSAMGSIATVAGLALPMAVAAIAAKVVRYMALYDIYTSMDPANSVMFLVLSILFGITEPFFLFFNRNKEGGMPPRREEPVYEAYQQPETGRDYL